ncbi:MAG: hypothetical protein P4L33_20550 [Capsulimonadaceae bacterium]|nr:hypothetical protein [Capsulimonadaceae bacterium]
MKSYCKFQTYYAAGITPLRYVTLAATLVFCLYNASAAPIELLANPSFENPYAPLPAAIGKAQITGSVPKGWEDNSGWGDVTIQYAEVRSDVHAGASALSIDVKGVRAGRAQFGQVVSALAGHTYAMSVWLKGQTGAVATLALRLGDKPYTTYGERAVTLSGQWQQLKLTTVAQSSLPCYFMIYPPVGSALLVDNASDTDVTAVASDMPARRGNLLPDASFEAGVGGGWSAHAAAADTAQTPLFESTEPRPIIDRTTAADQKQSIKVVLPAAGWVALSSPLVDYNYGRRHTASIAMKASVPGVRATLKVLGASQTAEVVLGSSWQHYSLSCVIPYGDATRLTVTATTTEAATVWFDGARLSEGDGAENRSADPELVLSVPRPGGIYFDTEQAVIRVATANAPRGAVIRARVADLYGHIHELSPVDASSGLIRVAPDPIHPRGVFKLTAQLFDMKGEPICPPIQQVFARLPHPRNIVPERSYFGVHIPLSSDYFTIARAIGARWTRIHDASWVTDWPVVEPHPGQWAFYDGIVRAARQAGIEVLGMLDGGPAWASVKPKAIAGYFSNYNLVDAPNAMEAWKEYVSRVVGHYRGEIDCWEVWNEPWGPQFTPGSPAVYGALLKAAYPLAKSANPNAILAGIDADPALDSFTDQALRGADGSSSFDIFSYHDYYKSLYGGPAPAPAVNAAKFARIERGYGKTRPLWITESAPDERVESLYWPLGQEQLARGQCAKTVRFDITAIASGVEHVFYYTLHGDPAYGETTYSGLEHDLTIRPIMAARAVLASLIDGAKCRGRSEPIPGVDSYRFVQPGGQLVDVLWSYDGHTHTFKVLPGYKAIDALGNPLSAHSVEIGVEPLYIVT